MKKVNQVIYIIDGNIAYILKFNNVKKFLFFGGFNFLNLVIKSIRASINTDITIPLFNYHDLNKSLINLVYAIQKIIKTYSFFQIIQKKFLVTELKSLWILFLIIF